MEGLLRALAWATHLRVLLLAVAKRKTGSVAGNVIALQLASCLNKTRRQNYQTILKAKAFRRIELGVWKQHFLRHTQQRLKKQQQSW